MKWSEILKKYNKEPKRFWNAPQNLDCVAMTVTLARELAAAGCEHVVATGTCAEYAWEHGFLREDLTPSAPASLYGAAKNAARQALLAYGREVETTFAWARFFFTFGPGEPSSRIIPSVTLALVPGSGLRVLGSECTRLAQTDSPPKGLLHAARISATLARNVEGGTVTR